MNINLRWGGSPSSISDSLLPFPCPVGFAFLLHLQVNWTWKPTSMSSTTREFLLINKWTSWQGGVGGGTIDGNFSRRRISRIATREDRSNNEWTDPSHCIEISPGSGLFPFYSTKFLVAHWWCLHCDCLSGCCCIIRKTKSSRKPNFAFFCLSQNNLSLAATVDTARSLFSSLTVACPPQDVQPVFMHKRY